jgi:EmrB/QacA subfamily drug resistance transporter
MSFIDGTAVNVALPVLQRDFGAAAAAAQWVVEGYSLFLSALVILGGSLGDIFGRRLAYGAGIALFALASLACALAPSIEWLIVARCAQGIGGALATPGSLALISAAYTGEARGRAIGTWSGFSAMTAALGPVLGGWLVSAGSWRLVFAINLPLAAGVLVLLAIGVDESRDETMSRSVDYPGAALVTAGLGGIVYGFIRFQATPDALGLAAVAVGAVLLAAFVQLEARAQHPMIDLALFRVRAFAVANLYTFALYGAVGGSLLFLPFDLINVQGYPPAEAGAALLPFIIIMFAFSRVSGGLVVRIGARIPLVLGALLAAAGFALFAGAGIGRSYWISFFPAAVVLGLGAACYVAPLTTTVMDALSAEHAGIASAINNAVSRCAGLIAIAVLGIVLAGVFSGRLARELEPGSVGPAALAVLARDRSEVVAGIVPAGIGDARDRATVTRAIHEAYAGGFSVVMLCSAGLALIAAAIGLDPSFRRRPSSR